MRHLFFYAICLTTFAACSPHQDKLETALRLAGDNRPELEKVLDHYAQSPADSLKFRAARFLIENMPGHYTLAGTKVDRLRTQIDSDSSASYFLKKVLDITICYLDEMTYGTRKLEDVRHIKAGFLIHHIDRSFEKRDAYPWAQNIPFDMFLEYVLPYRFANERIDYWIDSLRIDSADVQEALFVDNARYTLWNTDDYLPVTEGKASLYHPLIKKVLRSSLHEECKNTAIITVLQARMSAIPASVDFFPHYANRNGYHYWHATHSPEFKELNIENSLEPPKGEYVPPFFLSSFQKDVSDEYFHTADIRVKPVVSPRPIPRYAYLCTFCDLNWTPAVIGEYSSKGIDFTDIGRNILYLPAVYYTFALKPIGYPFILNLDGTVDYLVPDTTTRLKARIERKYPFPKNVFQYEKEVQASAVYATNSLQTELLRPLASGMTMKKSYLETPIDTNQAYRYWLVLPARASACAEIAFFDSQGKEIRGQINEQFKNLYDRDPLTNQPAVTDQNAYATVDFGRPVSVSRVVLLPRSDGNGVYPGDEYELFYHDLDGWQSLGRCVATDYFLDYDNLPAGALYWLHNTPAASRNAPSPSPPPATSASGDKQ